MTGQARAAAGYAPRSRRECASCPVLLHRDRYDPVVTPVAGGIQDNLARHLIPHDRCFPPSVADRQVPPPPYAQRPGTAS
jgi:hypothetical protein